MLASNLTNENIRKYILFLYKIVPAADQLYIKKTEKDNNTLEA